MRKLLALLLLASVLSLSACAGLAGVPQVNIWVFFPKDVGPYTVHVEALDTTSGEQLANDDRHVAGGEYGPASLNYPGGHKVKLTVSVHLGVNVPSSSYIRLQDGGIGQVKKTCYPQIGATTVELRCSLTTNY